MSSYGNIGEGNPTPNPIIQVGLEALESDNLFFVENPEEQYVGLYHIHQDGTLMIGEGMMGVNHELKPNEIIFKKFGYQDLQETREVVSDIFYKIWFESNTLTDDEILSMQTTIRDGIKQTGRTEDEPLVFYKKDRNTLESRKDLQGETFEQMCQYIFENEITNNLENRPSNPPEGYVAGGAMSAPNLMAGTPSIGGQWRWNGNSWNRIIGGRLEDLFSIPDSETVGNITTYRIVFDNGRYEIIIAEEENGVFTNVLNLSQLTKPKTGSKIDPDKAREVLDTSIFELLPTQTTRQNEIDDFFSIFNSLIGNVPDFVDVNNDGFPESINDFDEDENERISSITGSQNPNASITRLNNQANLNNVNQTLESMRNRLNEYLKDADARLILGDAEDSLGGVTQTVDEFGNIIYRYTLADLQPEYENKSNGFLKIRKPNQAIIIRGQNNNLLEFQKQNENGVPSYLSDGFTITMWVRFVDKQSSGTLFNFGNPLEDGGSGFRLETRISIDNNENYRRWIRLVVKDDLVRDNHFGDENVKRRPASESSPLNFYAERNFHKLYPEIPTDDLNEWYFICATYNPNVIEPDNFDDNYEYIQNKQFWLNHIDENGEVVANSNLGAKCKVEIISKSDLLKARGYKVDDISNVVVSDEENGDDEIVVNVGGDIDIINPSNEQSSEEEAQEEESSVNPRDVLPETDVDIPDDIINFGAGGGRY